MGFTVQAPRRRTVSPGLTYGVDTLLRFKLHQMSLTQNQKQFDAELLHRKTVDKNMTAQQALETGALVKKTDAQTNLFEAQEQKVRAQTAFDKSSMGQMLKFATSRREGQSKITQVWLDMMKEQSPNMTNQTMAEVFSHVLASTQQASSLDPKSTMAGFLPAARANSNLMFNAQSNQDMRTAREFIEHFDSLDKDASVQKNLRSSIGTIRKIAAGDQISRIEIDRVFNAFQYNLNPEQALGVIGPNLPARKLSDEQLTTFLGSTRPTVEHRRLAETEAIGRGLPGFVPARSTVNAGANALTDPNSLTGTSNLETKTDASGKVLVKNPSDGLWYDRDQYLNNIRR